MQKSNTVVLLYNGQAAGRAEYKVEDTVDITSVVVDGVHNFGDVRKFFLRSLVLRMAGAGLPIVFIAPDEQSLPYIEEMNFLREKDEWYQYPEKIIFPKECEKGNKV